MLFGCFADRVVRRIDIRAVVAGLDLVLLG